jgi:quinol monooxygenase YgiN
MAASAKEDGNLLYCYAADRHEPGRFNVLELWASRAAFKGHLEAPHQRAFTEVRRTYAPPPPERPAPPPLLMFFGEYTPLTA